jgi:two-component system, OmpR family, response regulator
MSESRLEREIRVLLVEDDDRLAAFTAEFLRQKGLTVVIRADGAAAIAEADEHDFDVIVLDILLPSVDGNAVCRHIRQRQCVPIIMTTARTAELDRIAGLELGADDYVTKPFSVRELYARICAVVRRARGQFTSSGGALRVGDLVLNLGAMTGAMAGRPLHLTTYEFKILHVLGERQGRVVSREQLLQLAQGSAENSFDRSIDLMISRLRQKLQDDPRAPKLLRTVRGAGYMLAAEDSA